MSQAPQIAPLRVRIGILEEYEKITFQMHGSYCVETMAGEMVREVKPSELKWRARVEQSVPAQFLFSILVNSYKRQSDAMELAESFEAQGYPCAVRQIGGPIEAEGIVVGDNTQYRVQVGNFKTEADARPLMDSLEDDYVARLVREVLRPATGAIELFDAGLEDTLTVHGGFRLVPTADDSWLTIFGVRTGSGFRYEPLEDRDYDGIIEVYFDHSGKLGVINDIPIDNYLRGVVPSEMPAGFPAEALKAQAILARTVLMAEKAIKHLNDPFELCAHVHCQVYSGLRQRDSRTGAAVDATKGLVLVNDRLLVEAHYSAVCGGHTEDGFATWNAPANHPLRGKPCWCGDSLNIPDLTTETGVRKWVQTTPDACCNLAGLDLPVSADYANKRFRWEITYGRTELEKIIREKTGVDVGTIYDVIPIQRGVSGRLMEIEVLGSRRNLRIKRELRIRRSLSESALPSSCFVVDVVNDSDGVPQEIVFTGAGWGHGVGLCQCGAARMAVEGKTCEEILDYYFPGTALEKIY